MSAVALALLLPTTAAWLALRAWRLPHRDASPLVVAALAFAGGATLSATFTYWFVQEWGALVPGFAVADAVLWTAVALAAGWQLRQRSAAAPPRIVDPVVSDARRATIGTWLACAGFVVVAVITAAYVLDEYRASPHGQWDAWAIWNQKARFLVRGGQDWLRFSAIDFANPAHPLLVSLSVARLWTYAGAEPTAAPAVFAACAGIAIAALVIGALDPRRPRAWLAGALVIAPANFPHLVAAQTADLHVALFCLATIVVLRAAWNALALDPEHAGLPLALAGLFTGAAAWTKNEGLALAAIVLPLVVFGCYRAGQLRAAMWWGAGALLPLGTVLWFKLGVAPTVATEYFGRQSTTGGLLQQLIALERHSLVLELAGPMWLRWGGPAAAGALPVVMGVVLFAALRRGIDTARLVAIIAAPMCLSYYAVWVVSPLDTTWLVTSTFDRLMMQLWPSLVLAAFSRTIASEAGAGTTAVVAAQRSGR